MDRAINILSVLTGLALGAAVLRTLRDIVWTLATLAEASR